MSNATGLFKVFRLIRLADGLGLSATLKDYYNYFMFG
jgi:hypothetical protein